MTAPSVKQVMSTTEQYPHYVPRLTLSYEGQLPGKKLPRSVRLNRLALWVGDERTAVPLMRAGKQAAANRLRWCDERQRC